MALAHKYSNEGKTFSDEHSIATATLDRDTYSPMLKSIDLTKDTLSMSIDSLLIYSLQMSDNNASDIILDIIGSTKYADKYVKSLGIDDIAIKWSEHEMYLDNRLSYENSATATAISKLLAIIRDSSQDPLLDRIKEIMETCTTGADRLAKPLTNTGARIGHKTGTGFMLPDGRLMAANDAAYVILPDGRSYTIAVLISDSGYDLTHTSEIIAHISRIVYEYLTSEQ